MNGKTLLLIGLGLLITGAAIWYGVNRVDPVPTEEDLALNVLSFADCEAAGYPVMESYPRKCATPDGRTYAEELPVADPTYINASSDIIVVENPTPGSVTGREFSVMGQARGYWFFEASFPIRVFDMDGNQIALSIGQPVGGADWMTEEFVPFSADIEIPESFSGLATLVISNDNPSGLPENDRSISFPITVSF